MNLPRAAGGLYILAIFCCMMVDKGALVDAGRRGAFNTDSAFTLTSGGSARTSSAGTGRGNRCVPLMSCSIPESDLKRHPTWHHSSFLV